MAVLQFGCPYCGAIAEVDADQAGQETVCPACNNAVVVPQSAAADTGVEVVSLEELRRSVPASKPKAAKNKLWQKAPDASSRTPEVSPLDAELPQPVSHAPSAKSPLTEPQPTGAEVVDLSLVGDETPVPASINHRAERVLRDQRLRRREISNAVMLVGSFAILLGALVGLLWLSSR